MTTAMNKYKYMFSHLKNKLSSASNILLLIRKYCHDIDEREEELRNYNMVCDALLQITVKKLLICQYSQKVSMILDMINKTDEDLNIHPLTDSSLRKFLTSEPKHLVGVQKKYHSSMANAYKEAYEYDTDFVKGRMIVCFWLYIYH